ncbi:hypothetical protein QYE76_025423 [Lolium multiflorum]|uniref:Retrotransposon Copia-like N-terminal domain-containing protein n=1 Tax=Lolium multiflorum TaxID=4521 RepID=A0AAD8RFP5_LOLMU|nr:hypothetical protein QYE76_025423 [Lolium multiflorum]
MAASSSSLAGNSPSRDVTEKLTPDKFLVWKAVVLHAVRGARLFGYLDGSVKAPAEKINVEKLVDGKTLQEEEENSLYAAWIEKDQQIRHVIDIFIDTVIAKPGSPIRFGSYEFTPHRFLSLNLLDLQGNMEMTLAASTITSTRRNSSAAGIAQIDESRRVIITRPFGWPDRINEFAYALDSPFGVFHVGGIRRSHIFGVNLVLCLNCDAARAGIERHTVHLQCPIFIGRGQCRQHRPRNHPKNGTPPGLCRQ